MRRKELISKKIYDVHETLYNPFFDRRKDSA